jgi:hypothetical protein
VLFLRPRQSIPRLQGSWYSARCHMGADLWSDVEDDPFPPEVRTLHEVDLRPGQSSPLLFRRDLLEVTLVLEGRLAIVDDLGSGEGRAKGAVHVASYGTGLALRRFNESMKEPVHFLRFCLPQGGGEKRASSVWSSPEANVYDHDAFEEVLLPVANEDADDHFLREHTSESGTGPHLSRGLNRIPCSCQWLCPGRHPGRRRHGGRWWSMWLH